ncbi:helix-turn-helix domain-containing protein [Streptomyces cocklensis]|uniref:HTH araC/xylS-type domain-containing protein n=1 Tax=Actinacidiphila cocklensis TaxID=887465 RepID=A0A9W4GTA9_9ACTN|nr:helix-turn-helix domain-containing protein [Actinacidiphila cocklensis]MDD1060801.1 helix-turn-helix domain-containing protein [Actinacidiphila cocklensis]CAG6396821.1 HTH araC/xylS-type domain-containing protein [Actinacidiphila cocklensis]
MIRTIFRSDDLPREERLARFDELQGKSVYPMRVRSDDAMEFRATARELELRSVNVLELTCSPAEVWRTSKLIRASDPGLYSVVFSSGGGIGLSQLGREAVLGEGDFAVYDSSQPFDLRITAGQGATTTLTRIHVPRSLLVLPQNKVDEILAVPLPSRQGLGALLTQFFTTLIADTSPYGPSDIPRLGNVAVELLTSTLAHHVDAAGRTAPESQGGLLHLRVQAFIRQHLHDPQLTPGVIAAAHHISVSYLHRLFQAQETTVSAWIRGQRLEQARRELGQPALRTVPVHRIAARWGFNDHATFTRAFRAAYDIPPKDYRHHALGPKQPQGPDGHGRPPGGAPGALQEAPSAGRDLADPP